jgi:hypothetical protein
MFVFPAGSCKCLILQVRHLLGIQQQGCVQRGSEYRNWGVVGSACGALLVCRVLQFCLGGFWTPQGTGLRMFCLVWCFSSSASTFSTAGVCLLLVTI